MTERDDLLSRLPEIRARLLAYEQALDTGTSAEAYKARAAMDDWCYTDIKHLLAVVLCLKSELDLERGRVEGVREGLELRERLKR